MYRSYAGLIQPIFVGFDNSGWSSMSKRRACDNWWYFQDAYHQNGF